MAISIPKLQSYIGAELNVLVKGQAGTGKTAMLNRACANLGWRMKYYSASTLDPFADLVGIPVPDTERKVVEYYRPREVDEAEVIFFDEANRADVKTLNAIFEIIQFRSINGEPLPNLKCVVVAINPVEEGYDTEELDIALLDRFDVYLESEVEADYTYLKGKYGTDYARVGRDLFNDYQKSYKASLRSKKNEMGYFSPRRLDKLMEIFIKFPEAATITAVLPSNVIVSPKKWTEAFNIALGNVSSGRPVAAAPAPVGATAPVGSKEDFRTQVGMTAENMRRKANAPDFLSAYRYAQAEGTKQDVQKLLTALATALNYGVGPDTVYSVWGEAVKDFNPRQRTTMMSGWTRVKNEKMDSLFKRLESEYSATGV